MSYLKKIGQNEVFVKTSTENYLSWRPGHGYEANLSLRGHYGPLEVAFSMSFTLTSDFLLFTRGSASQIQARPPNLVCEFARFMTAW